MREKKLLKAERKIPLSIRPSYMHMLVVGVEDHPESSLNCDSLQDVVSLHAQAPTHLEKAIWQVAISA